MQDTMLPDWTATAQAGKQVDVHALCREAAAFVVKSPAEREKWVREYSNQFCRPNLSFPEASGLYLLLRAAFELPENQPRDAAKVFGGWLHPSVKAGSGPFDLAWPVHVRNNRMVVERFRGYAKGPYDGIAEYLYFAQFFRLRGPQQLQRLEGTEGGTPVA